MPPYIMHDNLLFVKTKSKMCLMLKFHIKMEFWFAIFRKQLFHF